MSIYGYVTNSGSGSVSKVALGSLVAVGSPLTVGGSLLGVAVDPSNTYGYVASPSANTVTKINLSTFTTVGTALTVGIDPQIIVIDSTGTYAYVTNLSDSTVSKIQLSSFTVVATLSVGSSLSPSCIVIDPAGSYAYTANGVGSVTKINLSTFTVVGSPLSTGGSTDPQMIDIDPAGTFAYVSDFMGHLIKINLSTFTVTSTLAVTAYGPNTIAIDSAGTNAYVTNQGAGTVTKVNLSTFTIVGSPLAVGSDTQGIVCLGSTFAYVVSQNSNTVSLINLSTFTVVGSPLTVGSTPRQIALDSLPGTAPYAPTLSAPANGSTQDATAPITFSMVYNSTDYFSQSAYLLRIKVSGFAYLYWNATTLALQSGIVWNTLATPTLPGGTLTITLPASTLTNVGNNHYNFSFASQESASGTDGPFASDFTFTANAAPVVTITAPLITSNSNVPTVTWTDTLGATTQSDYEVVIESGSYGIVPGSGSLAWDSGVTPSAAQSATSVVPLVPLTTYRVFVQITNSAGQLSAWAYATFAVANLIPTTPSITALAVNDQTTGMPLVQLTFQQGPDNQLTANQASLESGAFTGWNQGPNTTIGTSSTWSAVGTYSLSLTATAAGAVSALTLPGTIGLPVTPGSTVRAMASFHSPTTARACTVAINFYNAAGTLISTLTSTSVNSTLTGIGSQAFFTATVPALSAYMALVINGAGLSTSEVLDADAMLIAAGTSNLWSPGGYINTGGLVGPTGSRPVIQRSDGSYISGAGWNNFLTIPVSGTLTFYDPQAAPGTAYTYTAWTAGGGQGMAGPGYVPAVSSLASAPSASVTLTTNGYWWIFDPYQLETVCVRFLMKSNWQPIIKESGALYMPLDYAYETKSTGGTKGVGGIISIYTGDSLANSAAAMKVVQQTQPLCFMTPTRGIYYVMSDPGMNQRGNIVPWWEVDQPQSEWQFNVVQTSRPGSAIWAGEI
ncbi:MAG TPA: YncE family protein [Acidimicrobiales bacterium]